MNGTITMYVSDRHFDVVRWAQEHYKRNFSKLVWGLLEDYVKDEMLREKEKQGKQQ